MVFKYSALVCNCAKNTQPRHNKSIFTIQIQSVVFKLLVAAF